LATKDSEKQEINHAIAMLYIKMGRFDKAIDIMKPLIEETYKVNNRGVLSLMELYLINSNYEKAYVTGQKYSANTPYNEYRLLKEFYSYVSNYLMGKEDIQTLKKL
jgi:lipopolysaccharide biosynthesis regulator YciM